MPTIEWVGKDKVINHHQEVPFRVLDYRYTYSKDGSFQDESKSENMIIHGDNLDALKALLPKFENKVKCIYIDPPYNTGNENWVYNDNVNDPKMKKWLGDVVGKEGEDLTRHDKWLCMIYPRLKLLNKLLSDNGAIFISIDDNELANLKLICDEIFGANNFVANIIWQKMYTVKNSAKYFSEMHDYILIYAKNKQLWAPNMLPRTSELDATYNNPDNDPRGPWTTNAVQARNFYSLGTYEIVSPAGKKFLPPKGTFWRVSKETFDDLCKDNRIWWGSNGQGIPRIKKFLSEAKQGVVPTTMWFQDKVGNNSDAKKELRQIFTDSDIELFSTPKPTSLIQNILQVASDKDSIILDSFAGSATTAHAVLKLNKIDNGNRKFILIEMENYSEDITAERIRRAISGSGMNEGTGGSFNYYELGDKLLDDDGRFNATVSLNQIREYVFFMETRSIMKLNLLKSPISNSPYYLGTYNQADYYLIYEKDCPTVLNHAFLATITRKAERYIIYADKNILSEAEMEKCNITFKKIPRDIARL